MPDAGVQAIVKALHVHPQNAIKVFLGSALNRSDMRDPGIIDENVNPLTTEDCVELLPGLGLDP